MRPFDEARDYLESLGVDAMKSLAPSMHRIDALCEAMNNPEKAVPAIHVTGTNGKTSTARIATSLLTATGLTVGTYTSPHLESVTERFCLAGEPVAEETFGELFGNLLPYVHMVEADLGERLSYFELLTGMFFYWAAEQPVDAMVVEVGLGGSWDATNVVPSQVSVITNIGLDHTGLLGESKDAIAREKAGIIKESSAVVTAERVPAVLEIISDVARDRDAMLSAFEKEFSLEDNRVAFGGRYLSITTSASRYPGLFLPLHGSHQGVNAATALEAVGRFLPAQTLDPDVVAEGMSSVVARGRIETVRSATAESPPIVLDVAHNPDGMSALVTSLIEAFAFDSVHFVIGVLHDKDFEGMLAEIARVPCSLVVTEPKTVRAVPTGELAAAAERLELPARAIPDVAVAVDMAVELALPSELICVTGSHYVVGEARGHLID